MSKLSQSDLVVQFLKTNPNKYFTAREIAIAITSQNADFYKAKKSAFKDEKAFIQQIVAEIGASKPNILKKEPAIRMQDQPRPRQYWFSQEVLEQSPPKETEYKSNISEKDLYPLLIQYLNKVFGLYCLRIDEKTSRNSKGENGNQWLHPDIVAMQAVDKGWSDIVKACAKESGQRVKLWSFEVKKELTRSNIRESFFQAVSNSSWSNEGYLVADDIKNDALEEVRILSALHGIGLIILDKINPTESKIILPAKRRIEIDWQSVERIVSENSDFRKYIEYVSVYYQTGKIFSENWNK